MKRKGNWEYGYIRSSEVDMKVCVTPFRIRQIPPPKDAEEILAKVEVSDEEGKIE